jgi:DNA-binding MarR family transcriptional regulator/GNAT superfamily N-acetyltransferase
MAVVAQQIAAIRDFNRFYTARLGLLSTRHLDGQFSLTEARVLYEIGTHPGINASTLCALLKLDAGYISRLLRSLTKRKLVRQAISKSDGRERLLALTQIGKTAVADLNAQSDLHIEKILGGIDSTQRESLVACLAQVRRVLDARRQTPLRIERLTKASDEAIDILHEYYEAVHVVQRDEPVNLKKLIGGPASGMWLARLGTKVVGCVLLKKLASIPSAGECKRLYVRPSARGMGIANKLLDAQEEFARLHSLKWIYLDTYDDLKPAIALYEQRGYQRCERYNDNPQATLFMRKRL